MVDVGIQVDDRLSTPKNDSRLGGGTPYDLAIPPEAEYSSDSGY